MENFEKTALPNLEIGKVNQEKINIKSYLVYLPKNYLEEATFPTIIFLHGAGERGTNVKDVARTGLPQKLQKDQNFPFIVIAPQCLPGTYWQPHKLESFAEEVLPHYKIDSNRLYLTGLSMGGYGTWMWAAYNPAKFAAIAPVCGGGNPENACRLAGVPIWAFHGAKDDIVPVIESVEMVEALKACGIEAKFTIYPNAYHDSWTETYSNPSLYEWLLMHKKTK